MQWLYVVTILPNCFHAQGSVSADNCSFVRFSDNQHNFALAGGL
jgi:hypothetical protein